MGLLLQEESSSMVYRLGGDEFAVLLNGGSREHYSQFLVTICERINREANLLGIPGSPADIALILYDQLPASLDILLIQMGRRWSGQNDETYGQWLPTIQDSEIPHRWMWR
jgi:GGDEF domain-containing protein